MNETSEVLELKSSKNAYSHIYMGQRLCRNYFEANYSKHYTSDILV